MTFWWRITKNWVNINLIRIQQESQKPEIIYLPDTWLTCLLGTHLSHLAALQDHLVNLNKSHGPANLESLGMESVASFSHLRQALFYREQFQVRSKIEQKSREFLYIPCPSTCTVSPRVSILHQSGPSVTTDEVTWTHHCHWKSVVYIGVVHSVIWTNVQQMFSIFTALKVLYIQPISPLAPGNHWSFYCLQRFAFCKCHVVELTTVCKRFQIGFFHLVICI